MSSAASPVLAGRLPQPTVSGFSCHIALDQGAARVGFEGELDPCALLSAARRARATGGRLVVVHGPGAVQRLFEIVDVTLEIELVDRPPSRLPPPRCWRREAA